MTETIQFKLQLFVIKYKKTHLNPPFIRVLKKFYFVKTNSILNSTEKPTSVLITFN